MTEVGNNGGMMISLTACRRCRQQKRKCSRDLPVCQRCREFEADCDYPLPPNRKFLAEQRLSRRENQKQNRCSKAICQVDRRLDLLQSYFSQFINSVVLFNKEDLFLNYWDKNIPEFLLRSLLAFSSIFAPGAIRSNINPHAQDPDISSSGEGYRCQCDSWVLQASRVMPVLMPSPSVEALLASFHLSLYWFSRGQINRARSIADSAFQSSLHLTLQGQANVLEFSSQSALSTFGVYWFIRCFVQKPRSVNPCFVLELPDKPKLSNVREFSQCVQAGQSSHCNHGSEELSTNSKFLALMGCWFRVRQFVHDLHVVEDPVSMLSALTKMDIHTTACYNSFNTEPVPSPSSNSTWLHRSLISEVLYHHCRAISHLYMFLCNLRRNTADHEFFQLSSIIGVRHILSLTEAMNRLLAITPSEQFSSFPPFLGYSSFLAATIQLGSILHLHNFYKQPFLETNDPLLRALRLCALTNLSTLNHLRYLWAPTQMMWEKVLTLASRVIISTRDIEAFGCHSRSMPIMDEITSTELHRLVSEHLSSILPIVDITEPFYLPFEADDSEVDIYRSSSPGTCGAETTSGPSNDPTHENLSSENKEAHHVLPDMHDHVNRLWDILY